MYVRWQSRQLNRDVHWRAVLVENVRVDGKPTQRHIAYLGGITESAIALDTPAQRIYFWNGVKRKLAGLKLSAKERTGIMQAITKRVPGVTRMQRQQLARWRRAKGFGPLGRSLAR